ncbi:NADH:ubiquinone oxidoreductase subunit 5 (chain L)/Multisubunit Na+/H+ antiporter, MnhA subunit protein [Herbaspirillum seropedicae SmR1]|uniref:Probable inorganic carbon transporter subunit DabB n=2 Tax=Herbaspirillum seropedicae TaxID=964 RepID=D8IV79_HERSS|nr:NADH:ubiquinone oxidoreductase subunit 5 (chain L)/Multisubunit Na+/H+ antiporter, MnhA subunit protein [Herbaspirillum seropedicae SmR1]
MRPSNHTLFSGAYIMFTLSHLTSLLPWAPPAAMFVTALALMLARPTPQGLWRLFQATSMLALTLAVLSLCLARGATPWPGVLQVSVIGLVLAVLVQGLGAVIGAFSARYLQGEGGQRQYAVALAAVLTAVHLLLLADHWLVLIAAWAAVGLALEHLLCFYPERPFARLAAYKKRIADRLADLLLGVAALLAWSATGSGSLSALWQHLAAHGMSAGLQVSALCVVLAVILRTALLPVHGWLIQVMEAPTPVSALLHAGVVNLGGFVLIRFAPLLQQAIPARSVLLLMAVATVLLAGMVMLTRISIKVRLAWSTVAQMGFMLLECAAGLYTFAALHLIGHSLYKAHAFLSASSVVRETRLQALHDKAQPSAASVIVAPLASSAVVLALQTLHAHTGWPWWWSVVLGLAWAPLLWLPQASTVSTAMRLRSWLLGLTGAAGLTVAAMLLHLLPLGLDDFAQPLFGMATLAGMLALYGCVALLLVRPQAMTAWRRRSYAGFYLDEAYTRLALQLWPARWAPQARRAPHRAPPSTLASDTQG